MKIIIYPHPILRKKTQEINVGQFGVKKIQDLGNRMIKTMYKAKGVGLAAPQVGLGIRLCVINASASEKLSGDLVLVNPIITARSIEKTAEEEACLSLPDISVKVERFYWIKVKGDDFEGVSYEFEARDFFARVIQHEVDHLDGVLIIDKQV